MEKLLMKAVPGRSMAKAVCWPNFTSSLTTSASTVVRLYLNFDKNDLSEIQLTNLESV